MQATTLLTSLDKQAGSVKSVKNTASADAGNNFNQLLNKEISNVNKPDNDFNRNTVKPAPAPKPDNNASSNTGNNINNNNNSNNNINNDNNNNSNNNKQVSTDNAANSPVKSSSSSDDTEKNGKVSKDDDKNTTPDEDISAQMLALVGSLAPAPVTVDTGKAALPADTGAATAATALPGTDASAPAAGNTITDATALASDGKYAETAGKLAATLDTQTAGTDKAGSVTGATAAEINAIAAQLMASKAAEKAGSKTADKTAPGIAANSAAENKLPGDTALITTPVLAATKDSTAKTQDAALTDTSKSEVVTSDLAQGGKAIDKTANAIPANAADTVKTFASDVTQARDAIADKIAEAKIGENSKVTMPVVAAPPVATLAVNNLQANAANSMAIDHISPRVGNAGWDKAVGQKVVWMVGEALQSAELTLNPPDLGPLQVVLKLSNDQANASFTAAQPEVREALEAALPRLRQMLSDAGVQLTGFSVNSQAAGQGQNFSQQQARDVGTTRQVSNVSDNATVTATSSAQPKTRVSNGVVDTFA